MILYLGSAHQNSWKILSYRNSYALTHQKLINNQLYSSDKMMVQVTKTHIILSLMIFHSTKSKNDLIFRVSTSKQLENTLFQKFICSHTSETNYQPTLQQWQDHGSSIENTYLLLIDNLPLNQKQIWFDIWIQHIKTIGNDSLSIICALTQ